MKADIVILSRNDELAAKAVSSVADFCDMSKIGRLVVGWTGEPRSAGLYMLTKLADGLGFETRVEQMEYNFARCNNALVAKHCSSEAVLFMNDDVELRSDAVSACLDTLGDEKVGTVGIKLLFPDGTIQHAGIFAAWKSDASLRGVGHIGYKSRAEFPDLWTAGSTGACMMTRRKDFVAVGGFDEGYERCFEDVQYNLEMPAKLGLRNVTLNSVSAVHAESATRKQSFSAGDVAKLAKYWAQNAAALLKALAKKPAVYSRYEGRNA